MTYEPYYYKHRRLGRSGFHDQMLAITKVYVTVLAIGCLWANALAPEIYGIAFSDSYAGAAGLAPLFVAGQFFAFSGLFLLKPLFFHMRLSTVPMVTGLSAVVGLALIPLLAPRIGSAAGGVALIGGSLVSLLGLYGAVRRIETPHFPLRLVLSLGTVVVAEAAALHLLPQPRELTGILVRAIGASVLTATCLAVLGPAALRTLWTQASGYLRGRALDAPTGPGPV